MEKKEVEGGDPPTPINSTVYGVHYYEDGSSYTGEWNDQGEKHGLGRLLLPDGTIYEGRFEEGLCSGIGVFKFSDGSRYEGQMEKGWFHGYGGFYRRDGMRFQGQFRGGRIWGYGNYKPRHNREFAAGLVTYADGSHGYPRNEGLFEDCRFVRRSSCPEIIHRAQKMALIARLQTEQ